MRSREAPGTRRGWVTAGLGGLAVTGLVLGVWFAANGSPDPVIGSGDARSEAQSVAPSVPRPEPTVSIAAGSDAGPASVFALFPPGESLPVDTSREVAVDVAGTWPLGACMPAAAETGRVDFVRGTEQGPEYTRDLAVGWYADDASAASAYDGLRAAVEACASTTGAEIARAPGDLGAASELTTVAQPAVDGVSEVSLYAVTRAGGTVTLAVDRATFQVGTVPAPADATSARAQAERLVTELCQAEPAHC